MAARNQTGNRSAGRRRKRKPRRKWLKLNRRNHLKMMIIFFGIVLALAGLMGRLVYIEHTSGQKYQKIVLAQSNYDSRVIPFRRGDILDCNGIALATSLDVYNIILDATQILSKEEYLEPTLAALMACFPQELSETEIRTFLRENPTSRYKILAKRIPYEEVQAFLDLQQGGKTDQKQSEKQKEAQKGVQDNKQDEKKRRIIQYFKKYQRNLV